MYSFHRHNAELDDYFDRVKSAYDRVTLRRGLARRTANNTARKPRVLRRPTIDRSLLHGTLKTDAYPPLRSAFSHYETLQWQSDHDMLGLEQTAHHNGPRATKGAET